MSNTLTAKVVSTRRAGTSYYGNPSYDVTLQTRDGDTLTELYSILWDENIRQNA